jgi:hypothetical protein
MSGRRTSLRLSLACAAVLGLAVSVEAAEADKPSFRHGLAMVFGGLLFELPRTVVEATLEGPPVAGTLIGVIAGTSRAVTTTFKGLREIGAGFNPWGRKKR